MTLNLISRIRSFFNHLNQESRRPSDPEKARNSLKKNFENDNTQKKNNEFLNKRKNQSMRDSQGNSDFSGSGYNGPGNVDHEKTNSNMAQRNF